MLDIVAVGRRMVLGYMIKMIGKTYKIPPKEVRAAAEILIPLTGWSTILAGLRSGAVSGRPTSPLTTAVCPIRNYT